MLGNYVKVNYKWIVNTQNTRKEKATNYFSWYLRQGHFEEEIKLMAQICKIDILNHTN